MARDTYMTGNRRWWEQRQGGTSGDARKDAAAHLSLMARRFVNDRAGAAEIEDAIRIWREAAPAASPVATPGRKDAP